jgi:hypothetical protein
MRTFTKGVKKPQQKNIEKAAATTNESILGYRYKDSIREVNISKFSKPSASSSSLLLSMRSRWPGEVIARVENVEQRQKMQKQEKPTSRAAAVWICGG